MAFNVGDRVTRKVYGPGTLVKIRTELLNNMMVYFDQTDTLLWVTHSELDYGHLYDLSLASKTIEAAAPEDVPEDGKEFAIMVMERMMDDRNKTVNRIIAHLEEDRDRAQAETSLIRSAVTAAIDTPFLTRDELENALWPEVEEIDVVAEEFCLRRMNQRAGYAEQAPPVMEDTDD